MAKIKTAIIQASDLKIDQKILKYAMDTSVDWVLKKAQEKVPVDTGELKRSLHAKVYANGDDTIVGEVGTPLEYGLYVEYGTGLFAANGDGRKDVPWCYQTADGKWHTTSGQKPQPYLEPALDECTNDILDLFKEAVKGK